MLDLDKVVVDPLDLYREAFRVALKKKLTARFTNSTVSHAIVLIEELLMAARYTVDIYCHALSSDVWCNEGVLSAMRNAFDRSVRFRVVVQTKPNSENEALKFIKEKQIPLRVYSVDASKESVECNFIVVDKESFRYEMDSANRHGSAYAANSEFSGLLNKLFEALFSKANTLDSDK